MRSAYLSLSVDSNEEAERIYNALTEGGEVFMKMGEQFFAHRFGQFRDKFGINWMVIHEKPMPRANWLRKTRVIANTQIEKQAMDCYPHLSR